MTGTSSPYSHPDAAVRHSYPLAIQDAGFGTALSLVGRTLPYALVRFGILVGFTLVTILWFSLTFGGAALLGSRVHPWVGTGWMIVGIGAYGYAWWFVVRYALYLIQAGHVAVQIEHTITEALPHEVVARFDLDQLYDYRARRPHVSFVEDHFEGFQTPGLSLRLVTDGL
ncbi:MAG: hypothetical protein NTY02_18955, partial [Acidobacteria bacterium]|nr:hypothetical protein [Acidobacteriota bacterium]